MIKTKAKEYLNQVRKMDSKINNRIDELQRWRDIATSVTPNYSTEATSNGGNTISRKIENAVINYVEAQNRLNADIAEAMAIREDIIKTIEKLKTDEANVLYQIYVNYKTCRNFNDCAEILNVAYTTAITWHGNALLHLQNILDEGGAKDE